MWENTEPEIADAESINRLIENRIPAVRYSGFASTEEMHALKEALFRYSRRTCSIKQIIRLGVSQYQQGLCESRENYFRQVQEVALEQQTIFRNSFDPVQRFADLLKKYSYDAAVMEEPGFGHYSPFAAKLRQGSSPVHVDFAPQDSAGWAVYDTAAQLSWNLYLDVPEKEGDLIIWDKQWQPEADSHMVENHYYFDESIVAEMPPLRIPVTSGDLLMINTRNFHAVSKTGNRLACGSFISVFQDKKLRLWI